MTNIQIVFIAQINAVYLQRVSFIWVWIYSHDVTKSKKAPSKKQYCSSLHFNLFFFVKDVMFQRIKFSFYLESAIEIWNHLFPSESRPRCDK